MSGARGPLARRRGRPRLRRGQIAASSVPSAVAAMLLLVAAAPATGQRFGGTDVIMGDSVVPVDMAIGRSIPMRTRVPIQRVSVANPEVADVVLIAEQELVVNALASGLTDLIIWLTDGRTSHYRVSVHSPTDRKQVVLQVRIAEASRDFLREIGASFLFQDQHTRAGTGAFSAEGVTRDDDGNITLRDISQFGTILSLNDVENLTGLLEVAEQTGKFKVLAEPNLIAANGEEATFLAGGELPIPIVQPQTLGGVQSVTIEFREFGIRLRFQPEILAEDLVKLQMEPEVSSLDFANAIVVSGFRVPAFRTRRTSTTVDLRPGQTLAIAGLLNSEEQKVNTGIPLLKDIPILGVLFSSQRFQRNETELMVLVTPTIVDPMSPPAPPPAPGSGVPGENPQDGGSP